MPREDRILSQDEIDSLLKKILPKTDKPAGSNEQASVGPAESALKPEEATPENPPTEPKEAVVEKPLDISTKPESSTKSEELVQPGQVTEVIKMSEYEPKSDISPPTSQPTETIKQEYTSDEMNDLKKRIADLVGEVSKLSIAAQNIVKLEEKVKQLESVIKFMPDSNKALKRKIDEICTVLEMDGGKTSSDTFLKEFICHHCRSKGNVAIYIKCTSCGKENWMGWWPDDNKE